MINLSADIAVFNIDVSEAEIRETMQTDIATGWISVWHKYAVTSYAYIYRIVLHEELSEEILFSSFSFMQEKGDFFSKEVPSIIDLWSSV